MEEEEYVQNHLINNWKKKASTKISTLAEGKTALLPPEETSGRKELIFCFTKCQKKFQKREIERSLHFLRKKRFYRLKDEK